MQPPASHHPRKNTKVNKLLAEPKREKLKVKNQKAVLAAVVLEDSEQSNEEDPLKELRGLVETGGVQVVGQLIQKRRMPHPATLMGKGKVEELRIMAESLGAELVVFDNNLSPSQGRNLERELDTVIVDRSEVILDIFASRARTYEAKLQVELAQLLYFQPRLKRLWTHLERIEGTLINRACTGRWACIPITGICYECSEGFNCRHECCGWNPSRRLAFSMLITLAEPSRGLRTGTFGANSLSSAAVDASKRMSSAAM